MHGLSHNTLLVPADGTPVPISLAYDPSMIQPGVSEKRAPCVLSVYGAYGREDDLGWSPTRCVECAI